MPALLLVIQLISLSGTFLTHAAAATAASSSSGAYSTLPAELKPYSSWALISPDGYTVPAELAALCSAPAPTPDAKAVSTFGPHANTFVRVFANAPAAAALKAHTELPAGSILVKEKGRDARTGVPSGWGVMVKRPKGVDAADGSWDFAYYPAAPGSSLASCADCHRSAPHDYLFTPYLK